MSVGTMRWAGLGRRLEVVGGGVLRYGLVGILLYYGGLKFYAFEARGIEPLMANSPLFRWLYAVLSVQGASNLIGMSELVAAGLIAARRLAPRASAAGSLLAVGMFLGTLSFLLTTPGVWKVVPGVPVRAPSEVGGFLLKDVFLLGAAIWTAGEAMGAALRRPSAT